MLEYGMRGFAAGSLSPVTRSCLCAIQPPLVDRIWCRWSANGSRKGVFRIVS